MRDNDGDGYEVYVSGLVVQGSDCNDEVIDSSGGF